MCAIDIREKLIAVSARLEANSTVCRQQKISGEEEDNKLKLQYSDTNRVLKNRFFAVCVCV